jgi:hypothetical protein
MCPALLGARRISERSADPFHPAAKTEASISSFIKRLRSHADHGAPGGLAREASNFCNYRGYARTSSLRKPSSISIHHDIQVMAVVAEGSFHGHRHQARHL